MLDDNRIAIDCNILLVESWRISRQLRLLGFQSTSLILHLSRYIKGYHQK